MIYFLNISLRFLLLIIVSVYHIRKDIGIIGDRIFAFAKDLDQEKAKLCANHFLWSSDGAENSFPD